MRKSWDKYFMDMAFMAATRSTCLGRHVGCVITKHNHVLSTGYNGSAPGEPHCEDVGCLEVDGKCERTIHAEDNAIRRLRGWNRRGSKLFCTDMPCFDCALKITNAGIIEVIYERPYIRHEEKVFELFKEEGIVIRQLSEIVQRQNVTPLK